MFWSTHNFEHVPVKDVVVREALFVEEVAEQLTEVRVVGFVVETQRTTEVEVRCQLSWTPTAAINVMKILLE